MLIVVLSACKKKPWPYFELLNFLYSQFQQLKLHRPVGLHVQYHPPPTIQSLHAPTTTWSIYFDTL